MSEENIHIRHAIEQARVVEKELAKTTVMIAAGITHPIREELITMRVPDWARLKRLLRRVENPSNNYAVWWSLLFGVSGTCFVGALGLAFTPGTPPKITQVLCGVALFIGIIGCLFLVRDRARQTKLKQDSSDIQLEVSNIDAALENSSEAASNAVSE